MDKEKLNSLAAEYKLSNSQDTFTEIYRMLESTWRRKVDSDAKRTLSDRSTILSLYDDALMYSIAKWETGTGNYFLHFLNRWINLKKSNLQRVNLREKRNLPRVDNPFYLEDGDNEDTPISNIVSDYCLVDDVMDKMYKKKKAQQVELLDFLLEPVKVRNDPSMNAIIELREWPEKIHALAKVLGIHHEVVKRRLNKLSSLSSRYDANRFGDLEDYLAV